MLIKFKFKKEINNTGAVLFRENALSFKYEFEIISIDPVFCSFLKSLDTNYIDGSSLIHINFKEKIVSKGGLRKSNISNDNFSFIFVPNGQTYLQKMSSKIHFFRFGFNSSKFNSEIPNLDELFIKSISILTNKYKTL